MRLSIVIVNYNVKHFLEQALVSVRKAIEGIPAEVFIVDNNSVDESVSMVQDQFPEFTLIQNKHNPGFSIANNQAIKLAQGEYLLLLNPDTVLEEDTLSKCLDFMDKDKKIGALGVKMIDGSGAFLPESKRGFPSPFVAFSKVTGLSKLFPKSKKFNKYHLGFLDENKNWEVDILSGAFMMMRKKVLDEVGFLDEQFFMYGEDIDLSYRIQLGGYKNYYFSDTQIIHYKGESTKKGSLNYVKAFYNAMILFAKKHFDKKKAGIFTFFISIAIYFKAALTLFKNLLNKAFFPIVDAVVLFIGFVLLKDFWSNYFYKDPTWFEDSVYYINFPVYVACWLASLFFNGSYDRPFEIGRLIRGLFIGLLIVAGIYGFLNLEYRSSRALIILGFLYSIVSLISFRLIYHYFKFGNIKLNENNKSRMMIIGSEPECTRALNLLNSAGVEKNVIGKIAVDEKSVKGDMINHIGQLEEIINVFRIDELIFCSKDINVGEIMNWMGKLGPKIQYKILPPNSLSIIGSHSKNQSGELYTIDIQYNIDSSLYRRNKRILDFLLALLFISLFPLLIWFIKEKAKFIKNCFHVLIGNKTWVSYLKGDSSNIDLPFLRAGVLSPASSAKNIKLNIGSRDRLNALYAKDYRLSNDLEIIFKNFSQLGN